MARKELQVNDILFGLDVGGAQSVGNMEMIPLVANSEHDEVSTDDDFCPPNVVNMGTRTYGTVEIRNTGNSLVIVPPGASWVVKELAQDHAIGGGKLIRQGEGAIIESAKCIQSSQSGPIRHGAHEMTLLPVEVRGVALAKRDERNFQGLWEALSAFNRIHGISPESSLVHFMTNFREQMDQFVAQFECVKNQIGAIIKMNNRVIGVELAPTRAYWESMWTPLIRVSYGSLAKECYAMAVKEGNFPISNRSPLLPKSRTFEGILESVRAAKVEKVKADRVILLKLAAMSVLEGSEDDRLGDYKLVSVALEGGDQMSKLGGQMVIDTKRRVPFFSACIF